MMRALWSGASGMIAQQTNLDTIANNISNVNTTGFKAEKAEFKSLLYQTIQSRSTSANGDDKPIGAQVGLGTRTASITSQFIQGALEATGSVTDFGISGDGFFQVTNADGDLYYTRDGSFNLVADGNNGLALVNADGYYVTSTNGNRITFPEGITANNITADASGTLSYYDANGNLVTQNIGLFQFPNPSGLEKLGSNLYQVSDASGAAMNEATTAGLTPSKLYQGYLEMSSVSVADEMVNMIVAQRAYEMNSKAITTSDDMLELANQLKR